MPQVWVPVPPELAFAVSQTTGEVRLSWDPFIRHQHLVAAHVRRHDDGARPVVLRPVRRGLALHLRDPDRGRRHDHGLEVHLCVRPRLLRRVAEPSGQHLPGQEVQCRIEAFARDCRNPEVLPAAL